MRQDTSRNSRFSLFAVIGLILCAFVPGATRAERADRDKPVNIESDRLTADDARKIATFDGRVVMTCHLKKGITFHDDPCFPGGKGREVTARDVYYAWQRMSDPKVECPIVSLLASPTGRAPSPSSVAIAEIASM